MLFLYNKHRTRALLLEVLQLTLGQHRQACHLSAFLQYPHCGSKQIKQRSPRFFLYFCHFCIPYFIFCLVSCAEVGQHCVTVSSYLVFLPWCVRFNQKKKKRKSQTILGISFISCHNADFFAVVFI